MRRCLIIEDDTENAQYVANGLRELGWPQKKTMACHTSKSAVPLFLGHYTSAATTLEEYLQS